MATVSNPNNFSLTALPGVRVGHWSNPVARTGCSVVLMPSGGAVTSCEVRGGAPGSRETALLEPTKSVELVHAIVLSGGSAFGLASADGVVAFLEAAGEGLRTPHAVVPIVPCAVIYDLGNGDAHVRPNAEAGLAAARAASDGPVLSGRVGAGTGAMTGKYLGFEGAEAGGLGSAGLRLPALDAQAGVLVSALAVVNPHGDVIAADGRVLSGAHKPDGGRPSETEVLQAMAGQPLGFLQTNTTLVVVGVGARLSKLECRKLAEAAHVGMARALRPSHSPFDGDIAFAFAVGDAPPPALTALVAAVQQVVAAAVRDAVSRDLTQR